MCVPDPEGARKGVLWGKGVFLGERLMVRLDQVAWIRFMS